MWCAQARPAPPAPSSRRRLAPSASAPPRFCPPAPSSSPTSTSGPAYVPLVPVPDVYAPRLTLLPVASLLQHIACDAVTNSELVVPLRNGKGEVVGVLDLDCEGLDGYGEADRVGVEEFVRVLEGLIRW